jgi:exopolysaccharide production protein ExoZ
MGRDGGGIRVSNGPGQINNLQVLRFVAAFLVVIAHALDIVAKQLPHLPERFVNFGAIGVDIFFVISGYIITRSGFLGRHQTAAGFAFNRIRRVVPLYWALSLPWLLITTIDGTFWIRRVLVTVTFWPATGYRVINPLLEIGWTLCFEMLFYAGATILLLFRTRLAVATLLIIYALCWWLRVSTELGTFRFLGNPIILEFGFGMAIALIEKRLPSHAGWLLLGAGVAGCLTSLLLGFGLVSESEFTTSGELSLTRAAIWGVPSGLIVAGAVLTSDWFAGAARQVLTRLGDASYAMYLVHPLWLYMVEKTFITLPIPLLIAIALAGSIIMSYAAHRWIEQPLLERLRLRRDSNARRSFTDNREGVTSPDPIHTR